MILNKNSFNSYISFSESNIGTIIYDKNKNPKEIAWKINRAFVFSRKDKGTWH